MPTTAIDLQRGDLIEVRWDDTDDITPAVVVNVDIGYGHIEVLLQNNPAPRISTWSIHPTQVVGRLGINVFSPTIDDTRS